MDPDAFLAMLKYLYCDEIDLNNDNVLATLYAAKKYLVPALGKINALKDMTSLLQILAAFKEVLQFKVVQFHEIFPTKNMNTLIIFIGSKKFPDIA